ncbi:MAG: hypothetical protein HZA88_09815 [Verrucomicrobia bacterium]|nr:hypothetical protein [Verrucomicrobiota bacterium]
MQLAIDGVIARELQFQADMHRCAFDATKQLFTVSWSGHVAPDEVRLFYTEVQQHLPEMKPGFRLLNDLSDLESMDFKCSVEIPPIMELFNAAGVAVIVRVIPNRRKDVGFGIMSLFHYRPEVRSMVCETREEAEKALQR